MSSLVESPNDDDDLWSTSAVMPGHAGSTSPSPLRAQAPDRASGLSAEAQPENEDAMEVDEPRTGHDPSITPRTTQPTRPASIPSQPRPVTSTNAQPRLPPTSRLPSLRRFVLSTRTGGANAGEASLLDQLQGRRSLSRLGAPDQTTNGSGARTVAGAPPPPPPPPPSGATAAVGAPVPGDGHLYVHAPILNMTHTPRGGWPRVEQRAFTSWRDGQSDRQADAWVRQEGPLAVLQFAGHGAQDAGNEGRLEEVQTFSALVLTSKQTRYALSPLSHKRTTHTATILAPPTSLSSA